MIDKTLADCKQAVAPVFDGATVMFGGFGNVGMPGQLMEALLLQGTRDLTVISNGAGSGDFALAALFRERRVRKLIASFPAPTSKHFRECYLKGEVELELVPQGTLVDRIRAGGSGLGGFYAPAGVGTELAAGKETRVINGREYLFELPLHADFVFLKAHRGDRFGNLCYRGTMRNFNMVMATAGKLVVAEVEEIVPAGSFSPESVHTPGIFVDHLVQVARHPGLADKPSEETAP
ncbi:MAG: 3-oxoadipate CoA-transferase [Betaproteobacteria bacterium RBG_16_64_18]|nr:MAG: 3-oxoadipate CoA-transferase [Betaproteobacteria bacterium RBG_16_64_18]OGA15112.1 MAG: 3-oxoadipate CoA-transferase [Betaproteobacteria bacterium RIFCSPLOWO2_02_FULL_65_20]OGA40957.1 MAG: 3-oxoadipate CoA-transferase [Betaproteobacteria bacterium RIFCSPLOWO2_12_FULL_65_110]